MPNSIITYGFGAYGDINKVITYGFYIGESVIIINPIVDLEFVVNITTSLWREVDI